MQSGAFWQEIDGSPVFHLCVNENITIVLDSDMYIVAYYFKFFSIMNALCFVL